MAYQLFSEGTTNESNYMITYLPPGYQDYSMSSVAQLEIENMDKEAYGKMLTNIPKGLMEEMDTIARVEHRTRAELVREAIRRYIEDFRRKQERVPA